MTNQKEPKNYSVMIYEFIHGENAGELTGTPGISSTVYETKNGHNLTKNLSEIKTIDHITFKQAIKVTKRVEEERKNLDRIKDEKNLTKLLQECLI